MTSKPILFIAFIALLVSCQNKDKTTFYAQLKDGRAIGIRLVEKKEEKENFAIQTFLKKDNSILDEWKLLYPVYNFEVADADNDGQEDIWVGVIKATRFDKKLSKRLFLFKIIEGKIRPLWLGSRMSQPLVNFSPFFDTKAQKYLIRTVEREKNGRYLVTDYQWKRFGVEFRSYQARELDSLEAFELLRKK